MVRTASLAGPGDLPSPAMVRPLSLAFALSFAVSLSAGAQAGATPLATVAVSPIRLGPVDSVITASESPLRDASTSASSRAGALVSVLGAVGRYVYRVARDESDDVPAAIERSIAHMNFIIRPIARHRLARTNRVPAEVTFAVTPDTLIVTFEQTNPIVTPVDGSAVPWVSGLSQEIYRVHITSAGDTLRQVIQASDGRRTDDFVFLDGGQRVALHVTLSANLLPRPVTYWLTFYRAGGHDATH